MLSIDHRLAFRHLLHDMGNRVAGVSTVLDLMTIEECGLTQDGSELLAAAVSAANLLRDAVEGTRELSMRLDGAETTEPVLVPVRHLIAESRRVAEHLSLEVVAEEAALDALVSVELASLTSVLGFMMRQHARDGESLQLCVSTDDSSVCLDLKASRRMTPSHVVDYFASCVATAHDARGGKSNAASPGYAIQLPIASA